MANSPFHQTPYIRGGDPDAHNETVANDREGEIGIKWTVNGIRRQKVLLDSGATSATPVGAVAAGQTAFWKDRATYRVTNDVRFSDGGYNSIAGVFTVAGTAGRVVCVSKKRNNYSVKAAGATWNVGDVAVPNTSSNAADVARVAAGTAPTYIPVGTVVGALANSAVPLNIDIPDVD